MITVQIAFRVPLSVAVEAESGEETLGKAREIAEDIFKLQALVFQAMDNGDHSFELEVMKQ